MRDIVSRGSLFVLFSVQKNDGVILSRQRKVEGSQIERQVPCASYSEILRRPTPRDHAVRRPGESRRGSGRLRMTPPIFWTWTFANDEGAVGKVPA